METIEADAEINDYTINELNYIRDNIESMNKFNQIEVLRILSKHNNVTLNENKYGVHVNLSELKKEYLDELSVYIKYVHAQEITLNAFEQQKEDYKNTYFSKDIKDMSKVLTITK
jgi:hypothetical protein